MAARKPPVKAPGYFKIVEFFGGFWDIFPWIGLVLAGVRIFVMFGDPPAIIFLIWFISYAVWGPLFIFWMILDVLYHNTGWWWILIGLLCFPIGLLLYLLKGREG